MPYKSEKQNRFFEMCRHNPGKAKKPCPTPKVIQKFESHKGGKKKR